MKQAFIPGEYDEKIQQTLPYYEDFYQQIVGIMKASGKRNLSWLDIGCGTGKMYEIVQEELSIREFTFTDISEKMLNIARRRFQMEGNYFRKMAAQELTAQDQYDVITAIQVNHYFTEENRRNVLNRCVNALKPGGFFFSFENVAPDSERGKELLLQRWKNYQIQKGKSIEEADSHIKRYGKEYFPITVESHFDVMRKSGFRVVELIWKSYMQAGFMGMKEEKSICP